MIRFLLTLVLFACIARPACADERILNFESTIVVEKNGDLDVREKITVRSEGVKIQRGIYRDIPRLQQGRWGLVKKKPFEVLGVRLDGKPVHYELSDIGKGGLRVRIGSEDVMLKPGVHTYEIHYRTGMQLYFEAERDVLYWNVNGTEWEFPTDQVSATVVLPKGLVINRVDGSTGSYGEQGRAFRAEMDLGTATISSTSPMNSKEGLTIVVEWTPGLLDPIAYEQAQTSWLRDYPLLVLALALLLAALAYYLVAWFLVGRDPEPGVIIPLYEPPAGFSPAAVRYLRRMGFDNTCFSAGVLGLAAKGVLKIEQEGKTYTLRRISNGRKAQELETDEAVLHKCLLGSLKELELKNTNHGRIGGARKELQKVLSMKLEKTHFLRNLKWWGWGLLLSLSGTLVMVFATGVGAPVLFLLLWLSIWTVGTTLLVSQCLSLWRSRSWGAAMGTSLFALPFVCGWFFGAGAFLAVTGIWSAAAFVLAGLLNVTFYHLIKAPTHLGRRLIDQIEGFRHYLSVAEEHRLNWSHPPEKTPELFERFLPYALALDCEQEWAQQFDEVLKTAGDSERGDGYRSTFVAGSHGGMSTAMAAAAIGGALTGALASSSSAPPSSGGGGSGGGGSSGGGGGGGGGGGW